VCRRSPCVLTPAWTTGPWWLDTTPRPTGVAVMGTARLPASGAITLKRKTIPVSFVDASPASSMPVASGPPLQWPLVSESCPTGSMATRTLRALPSQSNARIVSSAREGLEGHAEGRGSRADVVGSDGMRHILRRDDPFRPRLRKAHQSPDRHEVRRRDARPSLERWLGASGVTITATRTRSSQAQLLVKAETLINAYLFPVMPSRCDGGQDRRSSCHRRIR
jgi:hypothetical protein